MKGKLPTHIPIYVLMVFYDQKCQNKIQEKTSRHVFVKHGCPRRATKSKYGKNLYAYILTLSHPKEYVMSAKFKCDEPIDELALKVCLIYCIITQTLNIALCLYAGRNYRQTDGRTNGRTDRRSNYYILRRTFRAGGKKTERNRLKWSQNAPFAFFFFSKISRGVPRTPSFEGNSNHATLLQYRCSYSTEIRLRPRLIRQWI